MICSETNFRHQLKPQSSVNQPSLKSPLLIIFLGIDTFRKGSGFFCLGLPQFLYFSCQRRSHFPDYFFLLSWSVVLPFMRPVFSGHINCSLAYIKTNCIMYVLVGAEKWLLLWAPWFWKPCLLISFTPKALHRTRHSNCSINIYWVKLY